MQAANEWHVAINDIPVGPMRRDEVARKIAIGAVTLESLAWREGLDDWTPVQDIPELAHLFATQQLHGGMDFSSPALYQQGYPDTMGRPVQVEPISPTARGFNIPVGGRMASQVPTAEEFLSSLPAGEHGSRMSVSPITDGTGAAIPRPQGPPWAVMFVYASAAAFVMMMGAFIGVKILAPAAPPSEQQVVMENVAPDEPDEYDRSGGVIELESQDIDGVLEEEQKRKKSSSKSKDTEVSNKSSSSTKNGKELTEEQKALLARMGGGFNNATPSKLGTNYSSGNKKSGGGQGLTAKQLSPVVSKNKKQLQRCYEAALRASPSDETVRLDVEITVGMSGTVTNVKTKGDSLADMDRCISRTIRMWRFPEAGDVTRISFPLVFQPGA